MPKTPTPTQDMGPKTPTPDPPKHDYLKTIAEIKAHEDMQKLGDGLVELMKEQERTR